MQPLINDTLIKTAPCGAIDQSGHSLARMIHAFAEAKEDEKIFMDKWDEKDRFWQMDCREGERWIFEYVLPQPPGSPVILVIPSSLQMGWIELPSFFCAATETSRDIALQYSDTAVRSLKEHKFQAYLKGNVTFEEFQEKEGKRNLRYLLEVYVDTLCC